MPRLTIEGWRQAIPTGRHTLLDAALAADVPVPYECRAGECGNCKCRLLSGDIAHAENLDTALSPQEKAEGWILTCRAKARTDVTIAFATPLAQPRPHPQVYHARVFSHSHVAQDVVRLVLELETPLAFIAGQYVTLTLPNLPARKYSPANTPGSGFLEFFVRVFSDGEVSSHIAYDIKSGDPAVVTGPFGTAHLSTLLGNPIIAAGAGTGIAPILSILRQISVQAPELDVTVYYGVRRSSDLFASDAIAGMAPDLPGMRFQEILSEERRSDYSFGLIAPHLSKAHADLRKHHIYVAGPPVMVESVRDTALQLGAIAENIFADPFIASVPKNNVTRFRLPRWLKVHRS